MSTGRTTRRGASPTGSVTIALLLLVLAYFGLGASTCAGGGGTCQFDSDCTGNEYCVEGQCSPPCASDDDCRLPYDRCESRVLSAGEEPVSVCIDDDFNPSRDAGTDTGPECETNRDCASDFGEDAVCTIDGRCVIPVPDNNDAGPDVDTAPDADVGLDAEMDAGSDADGSTDTGDVGVDQDAADAGTDI